MDIKFFDKCCVRRSTDSVQKHGANPKDMTIYLNKRTLMASGLWWTKSRQAQAIDDVWTPSEHGLVRRYACPVCSRPMWCTAEDVRSPYITCRRCDCSEVGFLLAEENRLYLTAWTELMGQNYDPLTPGDSTVTGGVAPEWLDPLTFVLWCSRVLPHYVERCCVDYGHLWLGLRKGAAQWCERDVTIDTGEPKHKKFIKIC